MEETIFGYIRVSTKEQCEDRQMIALRNFSVPENQILWISSAERISIVPQYQKLLRKLKRGHVLVVKSIDRLGAQL